MLLMEVELMIPSFSIFVTFLVFLFMVLKIVKKTSKTSHTTLNLPPGPWKLPLIGNLHQLVVAGSLPHRGLRDLANKYGPLMHLQLGQLSTVVVSSPKFAKQVMKTHDVTFASRPSSLATNIMFYDATDIGFSPYGEYWRQLRKICILELLSMKRVQSFRSIREEEVSNLIHWLGSKAGSPVNLSEKIHSLAYSVTSRAAFGKKCKDQDLFLSILKEGIRLATDFNISDLFPSIKLLERITGIKSQLERVHQESDRILENIINDHKKEKTTSETDKIEDLVDVLLKVQEHGIGNLDFPLTTNNVKAVILDIFTAGSETCATTIDWAMSELMKNPNLMKKAQEEVREVITRIGSVDETAIHEMRYLKLIIKETLRLHPSIAMLLPRECGEKCVIDGFDIPIKTKVIVNAWAIGRDPEYWTEPESFIPERFLDCDTDYKGSNFEYIPFGAGKRICPGISFGIASVELPLAMLLYHFDWKLPNGDLDMTEGFGVSVRRRDDLCLIPIPYINHPCATLTTIAQINVSLLLPPPNEARLKKRSSL
ncbi:hypothetical protein Dsin_019265 [Dipteronia sinensis]|uniref:Cytochrome P450 n=1 Tax=Dipteronia sinensis TaxID=43782 RepID=A0AAE0A7R1_9ROSI|nr:hypothetical protein Dsin_019265 [Dipteronia sinensis]